MISIIIPIRRGEDISKCLDSIRRSKYKSYEIVVVDEGLERSRQRNIGMERARGEFFLILDSDQYVSPYLLLECEWLMRYGYSALYIPETIITNNWFGRLRNWERQFYTGTAVDCVRFVRARNCIRHEVNKSLQVNATINFEGLVIGTFDETMSGPEDSDWDRRITGARTVTTNCLYHEDGVTVLSYFSKKIYYTRSMRRYFEKWPHDKVLNFWYRCFGIFCENGKWQRFLARPFSALAVMLLIFARGVIYLCARKT
jgi:glycosyltransferase involved in cell wall biosynthesis